MKPLEFRRADDAAAAAAAVTSRPDAKYLAGGTNLVDLMKLGVATPDVLVDVRELTSTAVEELPGGGLRIGAT